MNVVGLEVPLLWASILIPIVVAVIVLFVRGAKATTTLSSSSLAVSAVLLVLAYLEALRRHAIVYDPLYARVPGLGELSLFMDSYGFMVAFSSAAVSAIVAAYSYWYMAHRFEEMGLGEDAWSLYHSLLLLFAAGLIGVGLASNAILFYVFLELTLIPSFLLIALYGYGERVRIALLYLVWTHVGSTLYLLGVLLAGYHAGADGFNVFTVDEGLRSGTWEYLTPRYIVEVALPMIIIGMGIKMALFGLHVWLPYAHAEAPTPLSALLSPNLIGVGAYGILRFAAQTAPHIFAGYMPLLLTWALITMVYGGLVALAQDDVKRFLAYSSVSQMGYLMLGLASATTLGYLGAMLHYVAHAFGKAALFMMAGVLIVAVHTRSMSKMGGLARIMPLTAAAALIGFLHLMGIPPTIGIWSKYFILRGFTEVIPSTMFTIAAIAVIVGTTLTAVYSLVSFRKIFLGPLPGAKPSHGHHHDGAGYEKEPLGMAILTLLVALVGIACFFALPWLDAVTPSW
ncbi:complex I subunit 4 family protein [Pyrolobus fumarii]|uniref:complex I subunit 4 family protein n=1 Tax=Pyrolobus fumarii TaxID=54252 RepID=UPI0014333AA4|nr:NADH-quinone oxidoreductase subunit M [Pyrolobus fumarii]